MIMKKRFLIAGPLIGLMAAGLACGPARAEQVKIQVNQDGAVIEVPESVPRITTFSPGVVPASLQADDIVAREVRAQTIYANKIKASRVDGMVHQTKGVKIKHAKGDIKVPQVQAGTIYADEIKADLVIADNIYVRDMDRK
jgi:hypothetical protein